MLRKPIMVFELLFLNRSLVHKFIGEFDFGEVVVFSSALVEELDGFFGLFLLFVNNSQIIVSLGVAVFLRLKEITQGTFGVLNLYWLRVYFLVWIVWAHLFVIVVNQT